ERFRVGLGLVLNAEVPAALVVRIAADEAAVALVADLEVGAAGAVVLTRDLAGVDLGILVGGQALPESRVVGAGGDEDAALAAGAVAHVGREHTLAVTLAAGLDAVAVLAALEQRALFVGRA